MTVMGTKDKKFCSFKNKFIKFGQLFDITVNLNKVLVGKEFCER